MHGMNHKWVILSHGEWETVLSLKMSLQIHDKWVVHIYPFEKKVDFYDKKVRFFNCLVGGKQFNGLSYVHSQILVTVLDNKVKLWDALDS